MLREANKKSKKKVPTRLVIEILEAKSQKEAKRIIASIGKAKGGGKEEQSASAPDMPKQKRHSTSSGESDSDDEDFLEKLMYVSRVLDATLYDPCKPANRTLIVKVQVVFCHKTNHIQSVVW